MSERGGGGGDKEIYTYDTPWTAYAMAWCRRQSEDAKFKMAIGSYKEEYSNQLHIIQLVREQSGLRKFRKLCEIDHPYPPTKVMWAPSKFNYGAGQTGGTVDLLATTGDYLRLWALDADNKADMKAILNNNKHTEFCAPLTSFDWSEADPTMLGTCSIDTTCTIWDVEVCDNIKVAHLSTKISPVHIPRFHISKIAPILTSFLFSERSASQKLS